MGDSVEEMSNSEPFTEDPFEKDDDIEEEEEEEEPLSEESKWVAQGDRVKNFFQRLSKEAVNIRVHDIIIKGNTKTKESLIESEVESLKNATTVQELLQLATIVNARLQGLEVFDAVNIMFDSGPPELPGTTNVVIQITEAKSPLTGNIGVYTRPEAKSASLEGTLKLKNLLGYADIWDGFLAYGWDQASEMSVGLALPKFKQISTPLSARISLLSQDWLKMSSYKDRALGLSLGLYSTRNHDLSYNLTWRTLTDPSQISSSSVRAQLGNSLVSALRYKFTIDRRDAPLRPKNGYAFVSRTHLAGLTPDSRSLRFLRQEFDLRYAFPLGFYNAALNFGLSAGVILPLESGFMSKSSPLPERFFLGGQSSPVCTLAGPTMLLGFNPRGVGPTELRRQTGNGSLATQDRDALGGDLACTAFADLSFDLPLKILRENGIHGHVFACTGNVTKVTENEYRNFSLEKFKDSFRTSVGAGIVVPTSLFRLEINFCRIVKQLANDHGKTGVQFCFSTPL